MISTSTMVEKSNGLAAGGSWSSQVVSTPLDSNGSSMSDWTSRSKTPLALTGEVRATTPGSWRSTMSGEPAVLAGGDPGDAVGVQRGADTPVGRDERDDGWCAPGGSAAGSGPGSRRRTAPSGWRTARVPVRRKSRNSTGISRARENVWDRLSRRRSVLNA